ncbi:unnamed protein product [Protopolystoma xenopodis]|uniref:Uncharacterized protein n=1 Tax=Protopolystoma xenopodis TaxID=117903 RepID=A0A3S4ZQJ7_9PLAT|nr:unnamed protein product [Protopolystoma xenopodis]
MVALDSISPLLHRLDRIYQACLPDNELFLSSPSPTDITPPPSSFHRVSPPKNLFLSLGPAVSTFFTSASAGLRAFAALRNRTHLTLICSLLNRLCTDNGSGRSGVFNSVPTNISSKFSGSRGIPDSSAVALTLSDFIDSHWAKCRQVMLVPRLEMVADISMILPLRTTISNPAV